MQSVVITFSDEQMTKTLFFEHLFYLQLTGARAPSKRSLPWSFSRLYLSFCSICLLPFYSRSQYSSCFKSARKLSRRREHTSRPVASKLSTLLLSAPNKSLMIGMYIATSSPGERTVHKDCVGSISGDRRLYRERRRANQRLALTKLPNLTQRNKTCLAAALEGGMWQVIFRDIYPLILDHVR